VTATSAFELVAFSFSAAAAASTGCGQGMAAGDALGCACTQPNCCICLSASVLGARWLAGRLPLCVHAMALQERVRAQARRCSMRGAQCWARWCWTSSLAA
jgi:hypothetical protein